LIIEDIKSPLIIEDIKSCSSDSLVEEKIFEKIPKNLDSNSQNSNKSTTKNASSKFDSPQLQNMNFSKTFTKIEMKKNTWSQYDDTNPSQEKTLSIDSQNIYKGFTTQCDLATTKRNDRPSYNKAQDIKIHKSQNFSGYINSFSDKNS